MKGGLNGRRVGRLTGVISDKSFHLLKGVNCCTHIIELFDDIINWKHQKF